MEILLHVKGKKLEKDDKAAIDEYVKRMSPFCKVKVVFHKELKGFLPKNGSFVVNVNKGGKAVSSTELAETINDICVNGYSRIEFVLSNEYLYEGADRDMAISYLDMSDGICVVALSEQLYRAFTILNNITYHK